MITKGHTRSALLFLTPNLAGFLLFLCGPLLVSLVMAFTNWDLRKKVDFQFVGFQNFVDLFSSREFWLYLINTIYFMLAIPFGIAGSLILALMLNKPLKENTYFGRIIHGGLVLLMGLVVGGFLYGMDTQGTRILSGLVMLAAIIYAIAIFAGIVVYRTLYYLPSFTSGVALFILWKALYNPQTGPINGMLNWVLDGAYGLNHFFSYVGIGPLSPPEWLQSLRNLLSLDPEHPGIHSGNFGVGARESIMFMGTVTGVGGGNMLLYLAGLSNIPQDLYEAADIDGANSWQRFWHVTWPQLAPTTFFITVMSCIGGLQGGFEVARVMTNGGPSGTTTTLSYYIYTKAFSEFRFGYASAVAWVLFVLVFLVTVINWRFGNRQLND